MTRTLHGRLLLVLTALLLPLCIVLVVLTYRAASAYYREISQQQYAGLAANLLRDSELVKGDTLDPDELSELTRMLAMTNPGVEIYVLGPDGEVRGASEGPADLLGREVALEPLARFLAPAPRYPVLGSDPRRGGRAIFSAAALPGGGYLYVVLNNDRQASIVRDVQASTVLRLSLWVSLAALALVLVAGALAFAVLTRRLRRLRTAMIAFRQADFRAAAPAPRRPGRARDEIDEVQGVFADMAARISSQLGALTEADRQRRELVTNISHDLRTPLAALQGYVETMQRKLDTLSPAELSDFLTAITRHSERLGRLMGQLFDLSALDAERELARPEAVAVGDLLQDVALKFRAAADARGVRLELEAPAGLPFVCADIGLLERALDNLIDNAVRHTAAGGTVVLAARSTAGGVELSVGDDGEGIAAAELPRIFERFYRAPSQRNRGGTGLGLAISRRIVELHGGALQVESRLGEGTRFWFELPAAADA